MKKLIIILSMLSLSQVGFAKEKKWLKHLKTYGIPCAVSLAAGALLVEEDGLQVGAVGCAAAGATIYVLEESRLEKPLSDEQMKVLEGKIQSSVRSEVGSLQENFKGAVEKSLNQALDKNSADIAKTLQMQSEDTKALMREVMAAQLVEIKEDMQKELFEKVQKGEFMPKLKEEIKKASMNAAKDEFAKNKKSIVEQATEKTIKQVIKEEVGVPANQ